jgi:uncharacterized protein (DUF2164 family)
MDSVTDDGVAYSYIARIAELEEEVARLQRKGKCSGCKIRQYILKEHETNAKLVKAEADAEALAEALDEYKLWEPGRAGHAAAHKRLYDALARYRGEK